MAEEKDQENKVDPSNDRLQIPVMRPPRKISKPNITLKMPPLSPQIAYNTPGGLVTIPLTPVTNLDSNYPVNVFHVYPNKAQEFMFKQLSEFKDFTLNKGKLGLSFGEKFALWIYEKISQYSKNNFTHFLLLGAIALYCILGGAAFYFFEGDLIEKWREDNIEKDNNFIKTISEELCNKTQSAAEIINCTTIKHGMDMVKTHFYTQYNLNIQKEEWGLLDSIYFCGTIFTTIAVLYHLSSHFSNNCKAEADPSESAQQKLCKKNVSPFTL
ncbi:hypothetical protein PGB90_005693 [Kerria lacca]